MNADVMSRDMLVASCLALLDQVATEHPAGHQGKLSARFIIRSRSGERVGLMFEKGGRTKPYLWAALAHASDLLEADVEFRVYLASSLYQDACSTGWRASIPLITGTHSTASRAAIPREGGRLHIHGAIDTAGLSKDDIDRLRMALRRAGSFAKGSLGGERQVDLSPIPDAAGWADYCLKDTSRLDLELGIDAPYMINSPMRRLARQHFEQLQGEVQDLHLAHKAMRLQRRRDAKQQTRHSPVFTLRSRRGMVEASGERDKKHVGGAAQRAPRRLQTRTPAVARSPKTTAPMTTPRKRGTA